MHPLEDMAMDFHQIEVQNKKFETADCVRLGFKIPENLKERFQNKAGQYITIELDVNGETCRRSYSLCTTPLENQWAIGVKRVPGGKVSNYLVDELKEGDILSIAAPEGSFIVTPKPEKKTDHYFIAAGSGITPVIAMIKAIIEEEPKSCCYLLYGSRSEDTIIFNEELRSLQSRYEGQLIIRHQLSSLAKSGVLGGLFSKKKKVEGNRHPGRITAKNFSQFLEDYPSLTGDRQFYICGPTSMMEAIKDQLRGKGVDQKTIHTEYFFIEEDDKAGASGAGKVTVLLEGETIEINVPADKTILDVLIEEGKNPPYSCTSGACSSCVAKVTSGEVTMDSCFALDDDEVAEGYILSCQAHPKTANVTIEYE